jgi:hypothetical protein
MPPFANPGILFFSAQEIMPTLVENISKSTYFQKIRVLTRDLPCNNPLFPAILQTIRMNRNPLLGSAIPAG